MHDERDKEHDQENEEQDFGDSGGSKGYKPEPQKASYQGNNQEDQSVVKHRFLLVLTTSESLPRTAKGRLQNIR
jgi:hypothetical protein